MIWYFTYESRDTRKSFSFVSQCQNHHETESPTGRNIWNKNKKIGPPGSRRGFLKLPVVLQRRAKKCIKNYNTRAQPLYSSLNLVSAWKGDTTFWNYLNTSTWLKMHVRRHATAWETPQNRKSWSKTCLVSCAHVFMLNDLGPPGTAKAVLFINRNPRATAHSIDRCSACLWLVNNSFELLRSTSG